MFVARPFNYALAAAGEAGVAHAAGLLKTEILRDMDMLGLSRLDDLRGRGLQRRRG